MDKIEKARLDHTSGGVEGRLIGIALGVEIRHDLRVVNVYGVRQHLLGLEGEIIQIGSEAFKTILYGADSGVGAQQLLPRVVELIDPKILQIGLVIVAQVVTDVDE